MTLPAKRPASPLWTCPDMDSTLSAVIRISTPARPPVICLDPGFRHVPDADLRPRFQFLETHPVEFLQRRERHVG